MIYWDDYWEKRIADCREGSLTIVTPPTDYPVTLQEVKDHCRIETDVDDGLLEIYLSSAVDRVETFTKRALMPQTWDWRLDGFPAWFDVPLPPLSSVTSIKYNDAGGVPQTLGTSQYVVDIYSIPGRIVPSLTGLWPSTYGLVNDVTVRFVAGYADAAAIPSAMKNAIMLIVGELYERREESQERPLNYVPLSAVQLMGPYQVFSL